MKQSIFLGFITLLFMASCQQESISLTKGNPSPEFENYRNSNGQLTSLKDFRGQYVLIDVWTTWCGNCMKETPYFDLIATAYQHKKIAFVSISVDKTKDYEKWKNFIKKKEPLGIQLFADQSFESQFIQDYQIKSVPRFILLDPEGNIISANAPRPSNKELIALLNTLKL